MLIYLQFKVENTTKLLIGCNLEVRKLLFWQELAESVGINKSNEVKILVTTLL